MEERLGKLFEIANDPRKERLFGMVIGQIASCWTQQPALTGTIFERLFFMIISRTIEKRLFAASLFGRMLREADTVYSGLLMDEEGMGLHGDSLFIKMSSVEARMSEFLSLVGTRSLQATLQDHSELRLENLALVQQLIADPKNYLYSRHEQYYASSGKGKNASEQQVLEKIGATENGVIKKIKNDRVEVETEITSKDFKQKSTRGKKAKSAASLALEMQNMFLKDLVQEEGLFLVQKKIKSVKFDAELKVPAPASGKGSSTMVITTYFHFFLRIARFLIFDVNWEVRHSASLIFRAISNSLPCKVLSFYAEFPHQEQFPDSGQLLKAFQENHAPLDSLLEDILFRNIILLGIDYFSDFLADKSNIMVREISCQLINAILARGCGNGEDLMNQVFRIIGFILRMEVREGSTSLWEPKHSTLYLIKYIVQSQPDLFPVIFKNFGADFLFLFPQNEEISDLIAEIVVKNCSVIHLEQNKDFYKDIYQMGWDLLEGIDEISCAAQMVAHLLDTIHSILMKSKASKDFFEKLKETVIDIESTGSLKKSKASKTTNLIGKETVFYKLFSHKSIHCRREGYQLLSTLLNGTNEKELVTAVHKPIEFLFYLCLQDLMQEYSKKSMQLLTNVISKLMSLMRKIANGGEKMYLIALDFIFTLPKIQESAKETHFFLRKFEQFPPELTGGGLSGLIAQQDLNNSTLSSDESYMRRIFKVMMLLGHICKEDKKQYEVIMDQLCENYITGEFIHRMIVLHLRAQVLIQSVEKNEKDSEAMDISQDLLEVFMQMDNVDVNNLDVLNDYLFWRKDLQTLVKHVFGVGFLAKNAEINKKFSWLKGALKMENTDNLSEQAYLQHEKATRFDVRGKAKEIYTMLEETRKQMVDIFPKNMSNTSEFRETLVLVNSINDSILPRIKKYWDECTLMVRRLKVLITYLFFIRAGAVSAEKPANLLDLVQNCIRSLDVERLWGIASISSDALARLSVAKIDGVDNLVTKIIPYFFGKFSALAGEEEIYDQDYFEEGKLVQKNEHLLYFFTQLHKYNPKLFKILESKMAEHLTKFPPQSIKQMVALKSFYKVMEEVGSDFLVKETSVFLFKFQEETFEGRDTSPVEFRNAFQSCVKRLFALCVKLPRFMTDFLSAIYEQVSGPKPFLFLEVIDGILSKRKEEFLDFAIIFLPKILKLLNNSSDRISEASYRIFGSILELSFLTDQSSSPASISGTKMSAKRSKGIKFLYEFKNGIDQGFKLPQGLNTKLRTYQEEAVRWITFLFRYNLNGALCDDMGLGKTIQSLTAMALIFEKAKKEKQKKKEKVMGLVVCPTILVEHWAQEVEKFFDPCVFQVVKYKKASEIPARSNTVLNSKANLIITSYYCVERLVDVFEGFEFKVAILDEAHVIRNPKSKLSQNTKRLLSQHKLALTGTPIQNNLLELHSIFQFLMKSFLGAEDKFKKDFNQFFELAVLSNDVSDFRDFDSASANLLQKLHLRMKPFILRREKSQVLKELPPRNFQDFLCDMPEEQERVYQAFEREQTGHLMSAEETEKAAKTNALTFLNSLRKICNHPVLTRKDIGQKLEDAMRDDSFKSEMPKGRFSVDFFDSGKFVGLQLLLSQMGFEPTKSQNGRSAPKKGRGMEIESIGESREEEETDKERIIGDNKNKILIFSRFRKTIELIQLFMSNYYAYLKPLRLTSEIKPADRFEVVRKFNLLMDHRVFLLTTKIGGLGLNLTAANNVIMFDHDYNPFVDLQAIDRAHRIGQKNVVNVYRLLCKGSLEEKIMGIQRFKATLAATVVNMENSTTANVKDSNMMTLLETVQPNEKAKANDPKKKVDPVSKKLQEVLGTESELANLWEEGDFKKDY